MFQLSVVFVMIVPYRHTTAKSLPEITFKVSTNTSKLTLTNAETSTLNVKILIKLSRS